MNNIDENYGETIAEEPYEPIESDEIIKHGRIKEFFDMSREEGYARGYRDGKLLILPTISICMSIFAIIIKFIL
ncbi:hypothetical protein ACPW7J_09665 [Ihubacter sp. rT4E-8]|uniref:hypothetical protein n=1 Tax=Ihubacter sp. rT4E-8 TaxID=3242369 RepID=UPI003CED7E47